MPFGSRQTPRPRSVQGAISRGTTSRVTPRPVTISTAAYDQEKKQRAKNEQRASSVEKPNQQTKQKPQTEKEKLNIPKEAWVLPPTLTPKEKVKEEKISVN